MIQVYMHFGVWFKNGGYFPESYVFISSPTNKQILTQLVVDRIRQHDTTLSLGYTVKPCLNEFEKKLVFTKMYLK